MQSSLKKIGRKIAFRTKVCNIIHWSILSESSAFCRPTFCFFRLLGCLQIATSFLSGPSGINRSELIDTCLMLQVNIAMTGSRIALQHRNRLEPSLESRPSKERNRMMWLLSIVPCCEISCCASAIQKNDFPQSIQRLRAASDKSFTQRQN